MSRCYTHDIEYSGSNCPYCEQERHHRNMEEHASQQTQAIQQQTQLMEDQHQRQIEREREQERKAAEEEERQRQANNKRAFISLIEDIQNSFGNKIVSNYFLRLAIMGREESGTHIIEEYMQDVFGPKMPEDDLNFIKIQQEYLNVFSNYSNDLNQLLFKEISNKKEKYEGNVKLVGTICMALGGLLGFMIGLDFATDIIFLFKPFIWIIATSIGVGVGSIPMFFIGGKDEIDEYQNSGMSKINEFKNIATYYNQERGQAEKLFDLLCKGRAFADAQIESWSNFDFKRKDVAILIQNEFEEMLHHYEQVKIYISSDKNNKKDDASHTSKSEADSSSSKLIKILAISAIFIGAGYFLYKDNSFLNRESKENSTSLSVNNSQKSEINIKATITDAQLNSPSSAPAPAPAPAPALESTSSPATAPVAIAEDNSPFAPSFDCSKANTGTERLICSDRELSKLDVALSVAYQKARDNSSDKDKLKKDQIDWIKYSLRACSDKKCIADAINTRLAQLK